jgi:hypothetical protein
MTLMLAFAALALNGAVAVMSICVVTGTRVAPFAGVTVAVVAVPASAMFWVAVALAATFAEALPLSDVPGTVAVRVTLPAIAGVT